MERLQKISFFEFWGGGAPYSGLSGGCPLKGCRLRWVVHLQGGPRGVRGPGLSGGRAARSNRCRFCMGDSRKNFDQVRKKCAEPELVCMVVSRFLKFPIQMNLLVVIFITWGIDKQVLEVSSVHQKSNCL